MTSLESLAAARTGMPQGIDRVARFHNAVAHPTPAPRPIHPPPRRSSPTISRCLPDGRRTVRPDRISRLQVVCLCRRRNAVGPPVPHPQPFREGLQPKIPGPACASEFTGRRFRHAGDPTAAAKGFDCHSCPDALGLSVDVFITRLEFSKGADTTQRVGG